MTKATVETACDAARWEARVHLLASKDEYLSDFYVAVNELVLEDPAFAEKVARRVRDNLSRRVLQRDRPPSYWKRLDDGLNAEPRGVWM